MNKKVCHRCKKDFTTDKKFVNCDECRKYRLKKSCNYINRVKAISDNKQCADCKMLYAANWICIHPNKRLRTLKELGIKYIRNGNNQYTYKKNALISRNKRPIPRDKFKIVII
jgi:hypothetical protein